MKTKLLILSFALRVFAFSLLAADKPNIIMILADDVGLGNLGCTGGPFKTPNIDALAKGGTLFSHCFAMPQCSPSRSEGLRR